MHLQLDASLAEGAGCTVSRRVALLHTLRQEAPMTFPHRSPPAECGVGIGGTI